MLRYQNWQLIRMASLAVALGTATGLVSAADFASVQTGAQLRPFLGSLQVLPGCGTDLRRGSAFESSGVLTCSALVGGTPANFQVFGEARGPTVAGQFGQLKTRAAIGYTESLTTPNSTTLTATSLAWFTDHLVYDSNLTHSMSFDFALHGTLELVAHPSITSDNDSKAMVDVVISVGSAYPGVFGGSTYRKVLNNRGLTSTSLTSSPGSSPDFQIRELLHPFTMQPTGEFRLNLGPSFFGTAPWGTTYPLDLDIRLFSQATIATRASFAPTAAHALSDYSNTFEMTGLHIFDPAGTDVTAQAFLGFASVAQIPEPAISVLFGVGLLGVVFRCGHRSRLELA